MKVFNYLKQRRNDLELGIEARFSSQEPTIQNDVPYVCQFAHLEYPERILKDGVPKTSDPDWAATGADSPEEYAKWVTTVCGMACTKMLFEYYKIHTPPIITLAKDAQSHAVYQETNNELSAMRYREYVDWLSKYNLAATIYTRLDSKKIQHLLNSGKFLIASVNPNIRGYDTAPIRQTGGHLVLVTGYDRNAKTITLHNPSGFVSLDTQVNHTLSEPEFLKHFAGRGIAVTNP